MIRITPELERRYRIENDLHRKLVGEFAASFFHVYIGLCVNCQSKFSGFEDNTMNSIGWGLALLFAVQLSMNITGSHVNPAVSFCSWTLGDISFKYFLCYAVVQIIACFFAAVFAFILYLDKINEFDGGLRLVYGEKATAQIFAAYPAPNMSIFGSVFNQCTSAAIMTVMVQIVSDPKNEIPIWAQSALTGAQATLIGIGFGYNAPPTVNPARDLGPRLLTLFVGYGTDVFSYNNYTWVWIPLLCPFIGTISGTWIYRFFVSFQISEPESLTNNESSCSTISTIA